MYSGKLPVVLLSTIASEADGSINCQIANYILKHLDEIAGITISELAKRCHVADSSISRFCRDIGLIDFIELKKLLANNELGELVHSQGNTIKERSIYLAMQAIKSLESAVNSLDYHVIEELVEDIAQYEDVAIFGHLKAETVAMNLQNDLLSLGKVTTTKVSFHQQMEYIKNAEKEQLIIIFSYTGIYFDYGFPKALLLKKRNFKIYFITSRKDAKKEEIYDRVIYFESLQDYASHPYQIQLIASIIAQNYAYKLQLCHKEKEENERN